MPSKTTSMGDKPLAIPLRRLCSFLVAVRENTADAIIPWSWSYLIAAEQLGSRPPAGLFLVIHGRKLLPGAVLHDETRADILD